MDLDTNRLRCLLGRCSRPLICLHLEYRISVWLASEFRHVAPRRLQYARSWISREVSQTVIAIIFPNMRIAAGSSKNWYLPDKMACAISSSVATSQCLAVLLVT